MAVRKGVWIIVGIGLAVSLLLAGVVSYYASSSPDGLEKVAEDIGFIDVRRGLGGRRVAPVGLRGVRGG